MKRETLWVEDRCPGRNEVSNHSEASKRTTFFIRGHTEGACWTPTTTRETERLWLGVRTEDAREGQKTRGRPRGGAESGKPCRGKWRREPWAGP